MATLQERLNTLASTTGLSIQSAANVLGSTTRLSTQQALNAYAGTTGLSIQGALNAKAGTTGLSAQDAANAISGVSYTLMDGYSETNADAVSAQVYDRLYSGNNTGFGQSFTADGGIITRADFFLGRSPLAPTGNAVCKIYTSTDVGDGFLGPDTLLATSDTIDVSTLSTTRTMKQFTFSTPYDTTASAVLIATVEYSGGDATHYVTTGYDTATGGTGHAGNFSYNLGGWIGDDTVDLCFAIYK